MKHSFPAAALFAIAALFAAMPARADAQSDWLNARQADYAAWQAAHPGAEGRIADLTAKTQALVAAYKARPTPPHYADLTARSNAASAADRQTALKAFSVGFTLWQSGDFPSAEAAFKQGLGLDPANGMANFYYGDCLQRRGDKNGAADYMARAVFFGGQSAEAFKAQTALANLPALPDPQIAAPSVIFRAPGAATELWDGPDTPQMVVVPAGEYTMGSPASEPERNLIEGPQHRVAIGYAFAVGKFDVTRAEYTAFVAATGYTAKGDADCYVYDGKAFNKSSRASWQRPGFDQTPGDPVVCVSWDDANAYAAWLSQRTGHTYRLMSESEWEYAARGGASAAYWWGNAVGTGNANCVGCGSKWDGRQTSPSGAFQANAFGLFDMNGDVNQWTADCGSHNSYDGAPKDGSVWDRCANFHMQRGGSWSLDSGFARAANRAASGDRDAATGFRVARTF